jgi:hypothetical protein
MEFKSSTPRSRGYPDALIQALNQVPSNHEIVDCVTEIRRGRISISVFAAEIL